MTRSRTFRMVRMTINLAVIWGIIFVAVTNSFLKLAEPMLFGLLIVTSALTIARLSAVRHFLYRCSTLPRRIKLWYCHRKFMAEVEKNERQGAVYGRIWRMDERGAVTCKRDFMMGPQWKGADHD